VKGVAAGNAFAAGDIASYPDAQSGNITRIEHWNVAGNHARYIARNISATAAQKPAGDNHTRFDKVPVFWSAQGQQLRYAGYGAQWDEVVIHGKPDEMKFVAYYVKDEDVVAVSSMQNDPVVSKASTLLRHRRMPPASMVSGDYESHALSSYLLLFFRFPPFFLSAPQIKKQGFDLLKVN
jgi:hypothetical protein